MRLLYSNFQDKLGMYFMLYDFDSDGLISKSDVSILYNSLNISNLDTGKDS